MDRFFDRPRWIMFLTSPVPPAGHGLARVQPLLRHADLRATGRPIRIRVYCNQVSTPRPEWNVRHARRRQDNMTCAGEAARGNGWTRREGRCAMTIYMRAPEHGRDNSLPRDRVVSRPQPARRPFAKREDPRRSSDVLHVGSFVPNRPACFAPRTPAARPRQCSLSSSAAADVRCSAVPQARS